LLRIALESALAQDFASLEIVVVDDSVGISGWRQRPELAGLLGDSRVRVVPFHQSRGCAAAKNAGLDAARGQWVCYLDDDNEYLPQKVSAQHALAVSTGAPVVLCGITNVVGRRHRERQTHTALFSADARLLDAVADTNVLFHRRDLDVRWDKALETVDDACFFQAILARYAVSEVPNVPRALVRYRSHRGPRANRDFGRLYRGQRRLQIRWASKYPRAARRLLLLRSLLAQGKYRGSWVAFGRTAIALLRTGGVRELRRVVNACGVRLPLVRRWMVT
jgi:glycosyltransferase involved in cell wall biosynthesis